MGRDWSTILAKCLVGMFAVSAWIDISGVFVELPLMVDVLPEGWRLPSIITFINQIANIATLAFFLFTRYSKRHVEIPVNFIIIFTGIASLTCMIFFWDHTTTIHGREYSVFFLLLIGLLSIVDCTSTLSFLAFISLYPETFVAPYFAGDGLSGLLPGVAALIQGVGGDIQCTNISLLNNTIMDNTTGYDISHSTTLPLFPVETFLGFLICMMCCSLAAYTLLNTLPSLLRLRVRNPKYSILIQSWTRNLAVKRTTANLLKRRQWQHGD
uniref:Riboflavin transporter n=1 Tax=Saccoglossus kowalevskii TaxID=10224 RepID=A0ABM0M2S3_SACKO|nr:PREDICTED: solute carrier family 52, riboflavin transporter, member 3-A-like [Saccoglossus kowalevskii]